MGVVGGRVWVGGWVGGCSVWGAGLGVGVYICMCMCVCVCFNSCTLPVPGLCDAH